MIHYIEQASELGAGTRGASLGIGALKVAARNKKSDVLFRYDSTSLEDYDHLLDQITTTPKAINISGIAQIYENLSQQVAAVIANEEFPLVLSGDHSSAGGTIAGLKKAFPNKTLGVVWIDAHGDLHSPYTTPSGNVHGMPLATALQINNEDRRINDVTGEALEAWNKMKALGGENKLSPENLIFVGVRDTEEPEEYLMSKHNIKNHTAEDVHSKGGHAIVNEILDQLKNCDMIYVSFDVDSMDSDIVGHGTGTPVPNGLTPDEAKTIIKSLLQNDKVACFEMVEINPCLDDQTNNMAEVSLDVLETAVQTLENRFNLIA